MSLYVLNTNGTYRVAETTEVVREALRLTQKAVRTGPFLSNPRAAREFVMTRIGHLEHEVFVVIYLNTRHRFIAYEEMFRGTIDGSAVHPREVVKGALQHNAAAVVFAHNHPSGDAGPSQADELITRRLKDALGLVDIRVLDHLIVGDGYCESFAERGLL